MENVLDQVLRLVYLASDLDCDTIFAIRASSSQHTAAPRCFSYREIWEAFPGAWAWCLWKWHVAGAPLPPHCRCHWNWKLLTGRYQPPLDRRRPDMLPPDDRYCLERTILGTPILHVLSWQDEIPTARPYVVGREGA